MGKTELILFGTKRKLSMHNEFSVVMSDGHIIKSKKSVVYLGLELNRYLDGEEIVLNITKKVNSRLKFLYRQANFFNHMVKKTNKQTNKQCAQLWFFAFLTVLFHLGMGASLKTILRDYNVPKTKVLDSSSKRISCII